MLYQSQTQIFKSEIQSRDSYNMPFLGVCCIKVFPEAHIFPHLYMCTSEQSVQRMYRCVHTVEAQPQPQVFIQSRRNSRVRRELVRLVDTNNNNIDARFLLKLVRNVNNLRCHQRVRC